MARSGVRGSRDVSSPDSVIFSADSNFSLFSSTCSVERCSFASDVHDRDSLLSDSSQHLAVHECGESSSSGPDLDPNKSTVHKNSLLCMKLEKAKEVSKVETDNEIQALSSARSSFSQALKDCQVRRFRSEALLNKADRRRPASLDLNNTVTNVVSSSPRFGVLKNSSVLTRRTDTFLSPGTPNYSRTSTAMEKGWSSERVALPISGKRRNVDNALLPFNNGRTLPSKWEDAERWICSPVLGDGSSRPSFPRPQRRPKAKSGPLGPPGTAYYSMYSPVVHMFHDGGTVDNFMASSPFISGVAADSFPVRRDTGSAGNRTLHERMEPCIERSVSVHGCSGTLRQSQSLLPSSYGSDIVEDDAKSISRDVSRRDMATQMSPDRSQHSSPKERHSFASSTNSVLPIVGWQNPHSTKQEIRDVQVDERVTMTRWCKKNKTRTTGKGSEYCDEWKRKALEVRSTTCEVFESANSISNIKCEDARITAWENLQKAKAVAAIRKLEMKLEKKRSSYMDKIMKKLKAAQKKAEEMRSSDIVKQPHHVTTTSYKLTLRRTCHISTISGCFTCHTSSL